MNQINIRTALIVCGLLVATQYTSIAQINESDTMKWQVRVSLTGSYQQGNAEILPSSPPGNAPRPRDGAVLFSTRRLRPVDQGRGSDRVL